MSLVKLSPIIVLAGLMLSGMDILLAAPLATIVAVALAILIDKFSFDEVFNAAIDNVKTFIIVFFILMAAYALAEAFMATGVGASIIILSLKMGLTAKSVAVTGLIVTGILSIATGTSWGTFAACAPIFLWLNHIVGGSPALTVAAIAGGSCFGDNIGLISDTTVVSSGIQGVEIIHRVRHQGVWSFMCLFLAAGAFYLAASSMGLGGNPGNAAEAIDAIPKDVWVNLAEKRASAVALLEQVRAGVPSYMIIPLIIVLGMAVKGIPTLLCLGAGIVSSLILGLVAGTVASVTEFLDLVYTGFSDAGSWSIVMMMWVGAFGGVMRLMKAFDPISEFILRVVKNVRQLIFGNGILCLLGNAALGDEMAQIVTIGPIIKDMTENNVEGSEEDMYKLALRNATLSDAFGVLGSQLIPWHCYIVFFVGIAATVYPLYSFVPMDIIKFNFMAFIAISSMLILTWTGWDRFIPLFRIPSEPDVQLKKVEEIETVPLKENPEEV